MERNLYWPEDKKWIWHISFVQKDFSWIFFCGITDAWSVRCNFATSNWVGSHNKDIKPHESKMRVKHANFQTYNRVTLEWAHHLLFNSVITSSVQEFYPLFLSFSVSNSKWNLGQHLPFMTGWNFHYLPSHYPGSRQRSNGSSLFNQRKVRKPRKCASDWPLTQREYIFVKNLFKINPSTAAGFGPGDCNLYKGGVQN